MRSRSGCCHRNSGEKQFCLIYRYVLPMILSVLVEGLIPGRLALAHPTYFDTKCAACHWNDTRTCNGCHHHGLPRVVFLDRDKYEPGSTVTVTLGGPVRSGWSRALLYNEKDEEVDRITGPVGMGDDSTTPAERFQYPFTLKGRAPMNPGFYKWQAAWWGSPYDVNNPTVFPHGPEVRIATREFEVMGLTGVRSWALYR